MENAIELTKELVRIESTNPGVEESKIREYICDYLADSGARIELDEVKKGRCNIVATIPGRGESLERDISGKHLVSEIHTRRPMLVLICHMDTVVVGKDWTRDPFGAEEINGRIYGRGSCDMKSGLACAMSVFKRTAVDVRDGKKVLSRPLRLIFTVDEEGFMTGVEHIIQSGYVTSQDWVLDLEPTDGQIQMAHKGRFWIELSVHGITAHASKPEQGADAIAAAAEMIVQIRKAFEDFPEHPKMGKSTITFGQIQGGYQPYVVPDECKVWIDCRLAPPVNDKKVLEIIEKASVSVKEKMAGIRVEYQITGNRPYIEINQKSQLLAGLKKAVRTVCGQELDAQVFPGYTDTAVIAGMLENKECMSYGPGSLKYAHKPDEFVECRDIERCEKVLSELVDAIGDGGF